MLNLYELISSGDGLSYQFSTISGDIYVAYFTSFFLQNKNGEELEIYSFGFDRKKAALDKNTRFDAGVKATIQFILLEFFRKNGNNAVIYVCLTSDGLARNRRITFSKWFNELADNFVKADSYAKYAEESFYCSIIVAKNNPHKDYLIAAFYHSLDYWMG